MCATSMFQSLVGKLETTSTNCQHHPGLMFQSLVGKLKAEMSNTRFFIPFDKHFQT